MATTKEAPPVLLFSHGTTMLTGEDSHIREYWLHHGNEALEYGIKGIVIMVRGLGAAYSTIESDLVNRERIGTSLDERSKSP